MRLFLFSILFFVFALQGQQQLVFFSLPDIAGTGSRVALASSGVARWCQLVAPAGNTAVVQWGDALITTTRGAALAAGGGQFIPPTAASSAGITTFQLNALFVLVQSGDSLRVTCAR